MKRMIVTNDGQPDVGSPNNNARTIINIIAIPEATQEKAPTKEAILRAHQKNL